LNNLVYFYLFTLICWISSTQPYTSYSRHWGLDSWGRSIARSRLVSISASTLTCRDLFLNRVKKISQKFHGKFQHVETKISWSRSKRYEYLPRPRLSTKELTSFNQKIVKYWSVWVSNLKQSWSVLILFSGLNQFWSASVKSLKQSWLFSVLVLLSVNIFFSLRTLSQ